MALLRPRDSLTSALVSPHQASEIPATDEEMDNLVYELYGITDEEREVIEAL